MTFRTKRGQNVLLPQINESHLVVQALYICFCIPSQLLLMCLSNQSKSAHCLGKDYLRKTSMAWIYLIRISRSRRLPLDSSSWRCVVWFSSPGGSSRVGGASERARPFVRREERRALGRSYVRVQDPVIWLRDLEGINPRNERGALASHSCAGTHSNSAWFEFLIQKNNSHLDACLDLGTVKITNMGIESIHIYVSSLLQLVFS